MTASQAQPMARRPRPAGKIRKNTSPAIQTGAATTDMPSATAREEGQRTDDDPVFGGVLHEMKRREIVAELPEGVGRRQHERDDPRKPRSARPQHPPLRCQEQADRQAALEPEHRDLVLQPDTQDDAQQNPQARRPARQNPQNDPGRDRPAEHVQGIHRVVRAHEQVDGDTMAATIARAIAYGPPSKSCAMAPTMKTVSAPASAGTRRIAITD